jgi:hypothetical protein
MMFLFTTPPARDTTATPADPVIDAIRQGAERTGTGFDYLLATAQRESALDPAARAKSSSASGLFQFIEQTWLGLVKSDGARLGLGQHAAAITTRADGTHVVSDPQARQAILSMREDPKVASLLAGSFTQRNRESLSAELGREPKGGELYVAHFLGARGAAQLINTAQRTPNRPVAADFPEAAAANRSIFYDRGRARGANEVYALLAANHPTTPPVSAAPAFAPDRPVAIAHDGPAFHGLFQTETRRGPMSESVAKLWRGGESTNERVKTAALGFFPKSRAAEEAPAPATPDAVAPVRDVAAPALRPALSEAAPAPASVKAGRRTGAPLDLSSFMRWRRT